MEGAPFHVGGTGRAPACCELRTGRCFGRLLIFMTTSATTVSQIVHGHCARDDGRVFLRLLSATGAAEEYAYREVVDRALRWARHYADVGLKPGRTVVVILHHSLDLYAAYLGALLGGQIPALFAFPSPKLALADYARSIGLLLENAQADLVLTYPELQRELASILPAEQFRRVGVRPVKLPIVPTWDCQEERSADEIAFLQYSSGTTGLKKGVAITHRALLWQVDAYRQAVRLEAGAQIVSWLPLYHDMGLICCFFLPLLTGIPVTAMSPFDWVKRPVILLQAVTKYRGTHCWLPNFAYNFLAQGVSDAEVASLDLSSLRGVVNCSEAVMAESHERFLARFQTAHFRAEALAASYAMAETTFAITSGGFGQPILTETIDARLLAAELRAELVGEGTPGARRQASSGVVLSGTEVRIVAEDGHDLSDRRVGEIAVRSPSLLHAYHCNPEATVAALRDGWLFTGDLGYRADSHLFVTGRKKDLIIMAGKNLFPQDIEDAVNQVPGVIPGRAVAFGVIDDAQGTEKLVILAETGRLSDALRISLTQSIYAAVAARTDSVPGDVRLVEHRWLIKSSSGKLSRAVNRQRYLELLAQEAAAPCILSSVSPEHSSEHTVLECIRRVLVRKRKHVPGRLDARTLLLRDGLIDSLSLVTLVMELESTLGVAIPARELVPENFETGVAIARLLRGQGRATATDPLAAPDESPEAMGYDAYVSLGFNCEPGLQFQRHGYHEGSFFRFTFSSLESTLALLRADFADVFLKENIVPHTDTLVRDVKYGVVFHSDLHSEVEATTGRREFKRDYNFDQVHRLYTTLTIQPLVQKWRALTASRQRVLYVLKLESGQGRDAAEAAHRTIQALYPAHRFCILCVQPETRREPDWNAPGLANRYLSRFAPIANAHDADHAGWDRLFAEFPLRRDTARRLTLPQLLSA